MLILSCAILIHLVGAGVARANESAPTPTSEVSAATVVTATVRTGANLRAGPGTNYPRVGGAKAGQVIEIVARNPTGDWYQLANGAWIFGNLVDNAPAVPVAENIPTPPAATPDLIPGTPTVSATNGAQQATVKVITNANLRGGPGTNYPKVGSVRAEQSLVIVAQNPEGDWYLTASGAWIFGELLDNPPATAPVAAEIPTPAPTEAPTRAATTGSVGDMRTRSVRPSECSFEDILACVEQAKVVFTGWLMADLLRRNILLVGLSLWAIALFIMLVRRRWRWTAHCILVTVLLLPIGWFITIWTGLLVLFNSDDTTSPRELVQAMVGSTSVQIFLLVLFFALTAVSILGGIIVFAMLAIGYLFLLRLLPGPDYGSSPTYYAPGLPASADSSSGYLSDGSDYVNSSSDSYRGYDPNSDRDDDRDDDRGGSIWDGWLVKW